MTKSLINLVGALVAAAILVLAAIVGVMPLLGQAFGAFGDAVQTGATNATYEAQISALQKQKARKGEIDAAVQDLRTQIPAVPDLDRAFDVIAGSAERSGAVITAITRGDLASYAPRKAPVPAGPGADAAAKAQTAPQPTPQPTGGSDPVAQAKSTAAQASSAADQTSQAAGASAPAAGGSTAATAATADVRQQIPLTVTATAPDMTAAQNFLDGLRGSGRLLGVDKATVQGGDGNLSITLDLVAFVAPATGPQGGAK
ncbi:conserved exported hypothetical protein [Microbacterium sp. 8M]|uniref:hypothetical protein n=1 Tax=Microbacterium sp. 8M TaxID=2653153 RepID=UPI0012F17256|nr:hypothetical protein [Microbacterium sp. 8M]VXB54900.1 conserved exported hypothetical protein [Microbacterium sp. 8M]